MTTNDIITHIITLVGGGAIWQLLNMFVLPKKDKKDFDTKIRDEMWRRITELEGQVKEQNKMLMTVIQENARLLFENSELKDQVNKAKEK